MFNDFPSFVIFLLVTSMTPGPNNITSMSFGLHYGYKGILSYMMGVISGVFCVFFSISTMLLYAASTPLAEVLYWMRYFGAAYILYLAYKTFMMNVDWQNQSAKEPRFIDGFLFQAVNPKLYFFVTTVLSTFINYEETTLYKLFWLSMLAVVMTFVCISTWGGMGAVLKVALQNETYKRIFGGAMALSLLYTAYRILIV